METPTRESVFAAAMLEQIDALYSYAMTLSRDKTEAEDLVQETYLRAAKAANQPAPDENLKAWLFTVMRNAWLNIRRHQRHGGRIFDHNAAGGAANDTTSNPHVVYLRKLERELVREAIASLPVRHQEVIVLRDIEGFSYHEIASVLDCPAGTVMSRLGRARGKLRQALDARQKVHRLYG